MSRVPGAECAHPIFSTPTRPATDAPAFVDDSAPVVGPAESPDITSPAVNTPIEHLERCDINARKWLTTEQTLLLDRALCSTTLYATWDQDFNLPRITIKPAAASSDIPFAKDTDGCLLIRADGEPVPDLKALEAVLRGNAQLERSDPVTLRVARVLKRTLKHPVAKTDK